MYGQITKFRHDLGIGVIEADDGRKFRFSRASVLNAGDELIGHNVDFLIELSRPREIILMAGSPWTAFGTISRN